jgi:uncharacterized membrane protein YfcA
MASIIIVALSSIAGGFIQGLTGFGSAIILMIFYPLCFNILQSAAISNCACIFLCLSLVIIYRKYIKLKRVLIPLVSFAVLNAAATFFAAHINAASLKPYLGILLVLLALYFIFFSKRIHLKGRPVEGIGFAALSGSMNGFFSISGPPMALYYISVLPDLNEYMATSQLFFLITYIYALGMRFVQHIIGREILPFAIIASIGIVAGQFCGVKAAARLNAKLVKYFVYIMVAVSGIVTIVTSIK